MIEAQGSINYNIIGPIIEAQGCTDYHSIRPYKPKDQKLPEHYTVEALGPVSWSLLKRS